MAALRWCFSFGVAFCLSVLLLRCSVMAQILLVLHFVGVGSILYRVIFCVPCRCFILPHSAIPIFYHFLPFLLPFFPFFNFSVRGRLKRSASFLGFCIMGVCAYVKLLQGLGVCVGCELLQAKVKKYHGKGCVSYPICCSHRGYVSYKNCCKEKGHYIDNTK